MSALKKQDRAQKTKLTQKELIRFWSIQYWRRLALISSEWVKTGRYISVGTDGSAGLIYTCRSEWNFWFVSHRGSSNRALNWTLYIYLNNLAYQNIMSQSERNQFICSDELKVWLFLKMYSIWDVAWDIYLPIHFFIFRYGIPLLYAVKYRNTTRHLNNLNWIPRIWSVCSKNVCNTLGNVCVCLCPELLISPLNLHLISGFGTIRQLNIFERRLYL